MDFSAALPTFIITLREGVEAALVVGIVLAYLKKSRHSHLKVWVYSGIGAGLAASAFIGLLFGGLIQRLSTSTQQYAPVFEPLLEGAFSLMAILCLSWMLLWMTQNARFMKQNIEGTLNSVFSHRAGMGWGIFTLIFFSVLREGFETVLFIAAKFQQGFVPALGVLAGLGVAIAISMLIFKWGIKLNLQKFFSVMGVLLLLIVAGLVVTTLGHFDTAVSTLSQLDRKSQSLCFFYERFAKPQDRDCILGPMIWNTSKALPQEQFPGILLNALFGYTQRLYLVQAVCYGLFLITFGGIYLKSLTGNMVFLHPNKGAVKSQRLPSQQKHLQKIKK
jgi:high-affinity iron transporter